MIGDWHLAFVTAACIASTGKKTLFVNPEGKQKPWKDFPTLSLMEPGLPEMIAQARATGNLDYSNEIGADWNADIVWLAIDTPVNDRDEADVTPLLRIAREVREAKGTEPVFAISSQIPIGFSRSLQKDLGFRVAYIPENLRLGKGIETFLRADRTVIGADSPETTTKLKELLAEFQTEFFFCDLVTSEMVKHATNAFLATSISFANELARIGELMGVDNQAVATALKMDKRIGKGAYVSPGLGFAGGTLPRDLRILQKFARENKVPSQLVDSVLNINEATADSLVSSMENYLGAIKGKTILVIGYTYKPEIDTLRRSSSLELAEKLKAAGATIWGYDPVMNTRDLRLLKGLIQHFNEWNEIPGAPDAMIIMTPRPQFAALDWSTLRKGASKKAPLVFDTRSTIPPSSVLKSGFAYKALWQPVVN